MNLFNQKGFYIHALAISLFQICLLTVTPLILPWDGHLYVASGHVLFSEQMLENYHWAREPGYPFMIWLTSKLGGVQLLLFLQTQFISIGIALTSSAYIKLMRESRFEKRHYLASLLASFLVHGYASSVLQQSMFILVAGIAIYLIVYLQETRVFESKFLFALFLLGILSSALNYAIGVILFCAFVIIGIWSKQSRKMVLRSCSALLAGIALVLLPWFTLKSSIQLPTETKYGSSSIGVDAGGLIALANPNRFLSTVGTGSALLNIANENIGPNLPVANENAIFGLPVFDETASCGRIYEPPPSVTVNYEDYLKQRCVPIQVIRLLNFLNVSSLTFLPIVGAILLAFSLVTIRLQTRFFSIVLTLLLMCAPYLILGIGISRYGIFLVPLGVLIFAELFTKSSTWLSSYTDKYRAV